MSGEERLVLWRRLSRMSAIAAVSTISLSVNYELLPVTRLAAIAQPSAELCPSPVLSRVQSHQVTAGETIDSIAADYNLLPVTLLAMNPSVPSGSLPAGTTLRIPPFNGVEVQVKSGQTWQDIATAYRVRADVLFEVNGCPDTLPIRIFVPGVSWLLDAATTNNSDATPDTDPLTSYPLAERGTIVSNYGWQTDPSREELVFSSGVTLEVARSTGVRAAGAGTVAYIGEEPGLGMLIVINHDQGFQTRYSKVMEPTVEIGGRVSAGQNIAVSVPQSEEPEMAELYFEVRTNSSLGWVARDPGDYIPELAVR